jgi:predicted enzyme related to lactoylglutathione lyase
VDVATAFYATVFGWEPAAHDMGHMVYTEMLVDGAGVAGAMPLPVEGIPPYWAVYFGHDAVDEAVVTATELGGSVVLEPMDGPPGRWAFIADPQGGVFAAMTLADRG